MSPAPVRVGLHFDPGPVRRALRQAAEGLRSMAKACHPFVHPERRRACNLCCPRRAERLARKKTRRAAGPRPAPHTHGYHAKTRRRNRRR